MATFMNTDCVQYLCSCEKKFAFCRLYLCKHCLALRCIDCVQHEVDTLLCPNCLEIMPLGEAKLKKNRCSYCFDCPVCRNTLMTRATTRDVQTASPNPDDAAKTPVKKMYYMACGFCRWTTRDVNLPDQNASSGGWPELENSNSSRISELLENLKQRAQVEKAERERKKYVQRRSHLYLQDKYGVSPSAMKRKGLSSLNTQSSLPGDIEASPTVETFAPLPEDFFSKPADLSKTTKLFNRLNLVEHQPSQITQLHPVNKHVIMKKSLRCKTCEHNLIKPDFNPSSIKFKLQLTALSLIPEVRIMSPSTFTYNKETVVTLTLSNPSIYNMAVNLKQIEDETDTDYCSAKVDLPKKEIVLAGRDETSMHVGMGGSPQHDFKDDPKVIIFRQGNKIGFVVKVTPLVKAGQIKTCFNLRHEFRSKTVEVLQSDSKEPEVTWLEHKVYLSLGAI